VEVVVEVVVVSPTVSSVSLAGCRVASCFVPSGERSLVRVNSPSGKVQSWLLGRVWRSA
jgi:hypothetical protein